MDGVILFADDKVFGNSYENEFFRSLLGEKTHPVLGVDSLEVLEKTIRSISTYKALIVDWNFAQGEDGIDGVEVPTETPASFLLGNEIYSLIYVYSDKQIEKTEDGQKLIEKYGNKIKFKQKNNSKATTAESAKSERDLILAEILEFEKANPNLEIPFIWSKSINRATQEIFRKFQDKELSDKIRNIATAGSDLNNPEDYAKVVRILYYSKVKDTAPIMTGDIIQLSPDNYGIIITPECDIRHVLTHPGNASFELLCFVKGDFHKSDFNLQATIKATALISKAEEQKKITFSTGEKTELSQMLNTQIRSAEGKLHVIAFTQPNPKIHLLPCFEFVGGDFSGIAKIDFRTGLKLITGNQISVPQRVGKLNTPYIQELRQRYFAYKGRVGVPNPSRQMREWLLDKN